jgi:adenylate cyclase
MAEERVQRRLAAIMAADVVGYSRLMGDDETGTLNALKELRAGVIDPTIREHRGRMVKVMGDGALVEFASVVDAVECAFAIQHTMADKNAGASDGKQIVFRIGINLGDIIIEGRDIYGDGVNVAARLEGLAEPGGICISGTVFDQVKGKLDLSFDDLGTQEVKNIAEPVRVYRIAVGPNADTELEPRTTDTDPLLPDKPSIAVLPFENMSGDPEQEYFSDGIAEDIITALSRVRQFFVVARNTTFTYKGRAVDVQTVAGELGVRYVLEGSVRRAGNRIRITTQLIDGGTGNHLWAERYDRDLEDIFDIQDEITQTVVGAIEPEIGRAERDRAKSKPAANLDAWDLYHRGLSQIWEQGEHGQSGNLEKALDNFNKCIEMDPQFARAYVGVAHCKFMLVILGQTERRAEVLDEGFTAARRAIELDRHDPFANAQLAALHLANHEPEEAIRGCKTAIALNPSYAHAYHWLGMSEISSGNALEGVQHGETSVQLAPRDTLVGPAMAWIAIGNLCLGEYEKTVDWARKALQLPSTQYRANAAIVSSYGHLGNQTEANRAHEQLLRRKSDFTIEFAEKAFPVVYPEYVAVFIDGLRKAGVPED